MNLSGRVIGCAIEVHRALGVGFLESGILKSKIQFNFLASLASLAEKNSSQKITQAVKA